MNRSCFNLAISLIGIAIIWVVAIIIATASAGTTAVAALVAAGIITAMAGKSVLDNYNNCRNRNRR
jgi:hypothetical protein